MNPELLAKISELCGLAKDQQSKLKPKETRLEKAANNLSANAAALKNRVQPSIFKTQTPWRGPIEQVTNTTVAPPTYVDFNAVFLNEAKSPEEKPLDRIKALANSISLEETSAQLTEEDKASLEKLFYDLTSKDSTEKTTYAALKSFNKSFGMKFATSNEPTDDNYLAPGNTRLLSLILDASANTSGVDANEKFQNLYAFIGYITKNKILPHLIDVATIPNNETAVWLAANMSTTEYDPNFDVLVKLLDLGADISIIPKNGPGKGKSILEIVANRIHLYPSTTDRYAVRDIVKQISLLKRVALPSDLPFLLKFEVTYFNKDLLLKIWSDVIAPLAVNLDPKSQAELKKTISENSQLIFAQALDLKQWWFIDKYFNNSENLNNLIIAACKTDKFLLLSSDVKLLKYIIANAPTIEINEEQLKSMLKYLINANEWSLVDKLLEKRTPISPDISKIVAVAAAKTRSLELIKKYIKPEHKESANLIDTAMRETREGKLDIVNYLIDSNLINPNDGMTFMNPDIDAINQYPFVHLVKSVMYSKSQGRATTTQLMINKGLSKETIDSAFNQQSRRRNSDDDVNYFGEAHNTLVKKLLKENSDEAFHIIKLLMTNKLITLDTKVNAKGDSLIATLLQQSDTTRIKALLTDNLITKEDLMKYWLSLEYRPLEKITQLIRLDANDFKKFREEEKALLTFIALDHKDYDAFKLYMTTNDVLPNIVINKLSFLAKLCKLLDNVTDTRLTELEKTAILKNLLISSGQNNSFAEALQLNTPNESKSVQIIFLAAFNYGLHTEIGELFATLEQSQMGKIMDILLPKMNPAQRALLPEKMKEYIPVQQSPEIQERLDQIESTLKANDYWGALRITAALPESFRPTPGTQLAQALELPLFAELFRIKDTQLLKKVYEQLDKGNDLSDFLSTNRYNGITNFVCPFTSDPVINPSALAMSNGDVSLFDKNSLKNPMATKNPLTGVDFNDKKNQILLPSRLMVKKIAANKTETPIPLMQVLTEYLKSRIELCRQELAEGTNPGRHLSM